MLETFSIFLVLWPPIMPHKVSSYSEAIQRYGEIAETGEWPDAHKWLVRFDMGYFPTLKLQHRGKIVTQMLVNRDMALPLYSAFNCIVSNNLEHEITEFDGIWNVRRVIGKSTQWSAHAYGLAIDLNARRYPYGTHGRQHPKLTECFTDQGFTYGVEFNQPDPHHFSYAWENSE